MRVFVVRQRDPIHGCVHAPEGWEKVVALETDKGEAMRKAQSLTARHLTAYVEEWECPSETHVRGQPCNPIEVHYPQIYGR